MIKILIIINKINKKKGGRGEDKPNAEYR